METENVLATTMESIAAGLEGVASSDRKELVLAVGRIFQRIRAHGFIEALLRNGKNFKREDRSKQTTQRANSTKRVSRSFWTFLTRILPIKSALTPSRVSSSRGRLSAYHPEIVFSLNKTCECVPLCLLVRL